MDNLIIRYENYKGGINNLIIAQDGYFGEYATSRKSEKQAINNLKAKLKRNKK